MNDEQKAPKRAYRFNGRQIAAFFAKGLIMASVFVFLAVHTFNFFTYTFKDDNWYYAFLGFGLTGVGALGYLIIFMWEAETPLKRFIALSMTIVSSIGEVIAAGFGMQIESWQKSGFALTQTDVQSMLFAIQILAFVHFLALVLYMAGDEIVDLFSKVKEEIEEVVSNRTNTKTPAAYAEDTKAPTLSDKLVELVNPTKGSGNNHK